MTKNKLQTGSEGGTLWVPRMSFLLRYGGRADYWRLPKGEAERAAFAVTVGTDGFAVLDAVATEADRANGWTCHERRLHWRVSAPGWPGAVTGDVGTGQRFAVCGAADRYATRAGVEGTIAQVVNACDARSARYKGLPKVRLEHILIATAINLIRLDAWWTGTPLGPTRTSHYARLELELAA